MLTFTTSTFPLEEGEAAPSTFLKGRDALSMETLRFLPHELNALLKDAPISLALRSVASARKVCVSLNYEVLSDVRFNVTLFSLLLSRHLSHLFPRSLLGEVVGVGLAEGRAKVSWSGYLASLSMARILSNASFVKSVSFIFVR